ncbi:MAG: 2-amino-4-hydroxy-6-hydroxymethyldihydropteridine diphosphokinase, partial [Gammaproteobacteria bacterium]
YGREAAPVRNAPRELDLDLLLFDDQTRDSADFTLPHPRAVNRLFVLAPAAEVLPDAIWPGTDQSIAELLAALETDERVMRLEELYA